MWDLYVPRKTGGIVMIIQSKKVWFADQFVEAQIEVKDGKIVDIYEYGTHPVDCDYGDNRILPGFIDVHCHGAYGFDTNDAKEDGLRYWVRNIVDEGVTALLATTITQSEEVLTNALKNVAKVVEDGYEGAEILGVHFEGPYLDMKYKGAQPEQCIVKPDLVAPGLGIISCGRIDKEKSGSGKWINKIYYDGNRDR
jgi:N-acetylglucosamine-6-phosphate deacetylase